MILEYVEIFCQWNIPKIFRNKNESEIINVEIIYICENILGYFLSELTTETFNSEHQFNNTSGFMANTKLTKHMSTTTLNHNPV